MVEGDSILWLRMMTVYIVAEETAKKRRLPTVAYAQEQPRDPGDYRTDIPREQLVSVWRFRGWKAFERGLGEVAGPGQGGEAWSENLQERIAQTKRWSAWAPGLVQAVKEALRDHAEGSQGEER